jgi:hypothetical protein
MRPFCPHGGQDVLNALAAATRTKRAERRAASAKNADRRPRSPVLAVLQGQPLLTSSASYAIHPTRLVLVAAMT